MIDPIRPGGPTPEDRALEAMTIAGTSTAQGTVTRRGGDVCGPDHELMKRTRRRLLQALGATALTAPFLRPRLAPAQGNPGGAKYLYLMLTNGTAPWIWTPTGSSATNVVFSEMTAPLEPLRSELVLVEGLSSNGTADNHGAPGGLSGEGYSSNSQTSIDQYVADELIAQGQASPVPSLLLGSVQSESQTDFRKNGQILTPFFSPVAAFDAAFGAAPPPGDDGDDERAAVLARRRARAKGILRSELEGIEADLGPSEAKKVQLHLESLQLLEDRLAGGGGGASCEGVTAPADAGQPLLNSRLHSELSVNAFACGITRVAAVQYGHHQSTQFDLDGVGTNDWHNGVLHNMGNAEQTLVQLERWLCEEFVAVANQLKSLPDPGGMGTLYDHTLMVWARDMGDAVNHNGDDMRFVFAGGAGGYLNTQPGGVYINGGGEAHQRALLNIAEAM
ncbi:MAG: DUF1552 domain-containing protein, partial [Myxococcota bacterium]